MSRHPLLSAALAAAAFGLTTTAAHAANATWQRDVAEPANKPLTREQVRQELAQARASGWKGYGSEETLDPQPRPTGVLSRAEVMADYRQWRDAGALDDDSEAGPSPAVQRRRLALYDRQVVQFARSVEAEWQRVAQEEALRRAAEQQQASSTAPAASPDGTVQSTAPTAEASAAPAATGGETGTTLGSGTQSEPMASEAPAAPAPQAPPEPGTPDAAVDTTRSRSEEPTGAETAPVR